MPHSTRLAALLLVVQPGWLCGQQSESGSVARAQDGPVRRAAAAAPLDEAVGSADEQGAPPAPEPTGVAARRPLPRAAQSARPAPRPAWGSDRALRLASATEPISASPATKPAVSPDQPAERGLRLAAPGPRSNGTRQTLASPTPTTLLAALGGVLGLFLLLALLVRRGLPRGSVLLPSQAVEVLGRTPLVGRLQMHLVRCGNKIVLLAISPTGVDALAEITDPQEVDRLAGICAQSDPASASNTFGRLFQQWGEPRPGRNIFGQSPPSPEAEAFAEAVRRGPRREAYDA
jgi:flagellar biogenesis protein FliO